ncbi:hypothetical protein K458DRAFT_420164 [Lentithecium fluviatile CBS 122367]|uniref:SGNH hydrolase n=1 Tax=Lentithecium fluviatile CBS 122367 TaxID=1168545 RepID=A0A6G1IWE1_9PLEO|nr:hypothetical protein K458DRAFT_420164 [Lentithecium fluviatile CBS 122367]
MSNAQNLPTDRKINTSKFYHEWKGHQIDDLERFHATTLQQRPSKPIIYLAGDSSLDNKYWVPSSGPGGEELAVEVPEIYAHALERARPKPDVAFWMNHVLGERATCINAALEESTLRERDGGLLAHDEFIRDNIREEDILIVSVGANDIALRPTTSTMRHMLQLTWLTRRSSITAGTASSLPHFAQLFHNNTEAYITRLTAKTKPRAVIVCMIYFPLEAQYGQKSWADMQLKMLGYERDPGQLQEAIRKMYEMGTCKIRVEGTEVVPCALFEVLDGKKADEYTARVEPSALGGRKMAKRFGALVEGILGRMSA